MSATNPKNASGRAAQKARPGLHIEDTLAFGKHKGRTLGEVFQKDPAYIDWCLANVRDFHIHPEAMANFHVWHPSFTLSEAAAARWAKNEGLL